MSMAKAHVKLLKSLRDDAKNNKLAAVSRRLGIPYMTLSDIINDLKNSRGTLRTWLKIERHYKG